MTATSSAMQLADIALTWSRDNDGADISLIDLDVASDAGLETAILLSLFTDRRAQDDDVPPSGDPSDRRGWWADEFADVEGDLIGSRLWLLERSKLTSEVSRRAVEYAREALAWMLEDLVAETVDVETAIAKLGGVAVLVIGVTVKRPGRDPVSFRFAHVWDQLAAAAGS